MQTKLKLGGAFATNRVRLLADRMNKHLSKTPKGAPLGAQIKQLAKLKRQQQAWEKIWKILIKQAADKQNKRERKNLLEAIREAKQNFDRSEQMITIQKKYLETELRKEP